MRVAPGFSWGALILGLAIGIGGGLAYAWLINPVRYENIGPRQLAATDQDQYVLMVSHAYSADLDLARAQKRLETLGQADSAAHVSALADAGYVHGSDPNDIRALTVLAEALGGHPLAAEVFSGTLPAPNNADGSATGTFEGIASLTPTSQEPSATPTPEIAVTATSTPISIPENATMKLTVLKPICVESDAAGRLEVYVVDQAGGGIAGVEIQVSWDGDSDSFFTGLKPEISSGYADFQMEPNLTYTVTLPGLSEPVVGINSADCLTETGQTTTPGYQLVFQPVGP